MTPGRRRINRRSSVGQTGRPSPALTAVGVVGLLVLLTPLLALVLTAPWGRMVGLLTSPSARSALWLSLASATLATLIATALGVPLAALLAGGISSDRLRATVRLAVLVPMVLPPVVIGAGLLAAFGRRAPIGSLLDSWFGWTPTYTFVAVVMAQLVVAMPFLVISVESALRARDVEAEEVAYTLGAGRLTTFWHVTLPMIRTGIGAGALLCFARCLGEFGATVTFAGNVEGVTQTLPLAIYLALVRDDQSAVAMSVGLVVVSVVILVGLRGRWVPGLWPDRTTRNRSA
ncbi:MAG TPA: molybdate ABC transporter permease subunit [Gordonia sp. (in: high G+C Gram-positive bacteria)]|uniref:molybdate ABC transporter permease subunit n=1 Tax=unclassified Gordonia (in: high G+C Gram-positive bacteria) TaxID=2657482 RepID=UPI0025C14B48|nr:MULTISPECIES: molybdate ABC transporter permease subunit [unclassified Gordonia (in: high G+C Gram-positive bacteria)]HNP57501.1 molybdate ABC transporter permease subunit [Gordonia sp. (in: high G+C Gram-positive bacteria)]HRC52721.1 molybdate ABC transporter permease subunit [Gordonia sp. (in: high G+C Gram-positive bacteria)]